MSSLEGYRSTVELHPHLVNDETRMTNVEAPLLVQSFLLRHSDFVIRHSCFVIELAEGLEPTTC